MNNLGPGGNISITFWLEDKKKCNGRDAYLGLMSIEGGEFSGEKIYAKITIYADNGEMAISNFANGENGLAFDDMSSQYNEFNIPLTLTHYSPTLVKTSTPKIIGTQQHLSCLKTSTVECQ